MRIVDLEQKSPEWLRWRKSLLTATAAPVIMEVSPYCTPYKLWQRYLGLAEEQVSTPAMERGVRDEDPARELFIKSSNINFAPCCVESGRYNFIGSSLDGISSDGKIILEIKSNGSDLHERIKKSGISAIPDYHIMQMQHQFISTDGQVESGFYLSYNNGDWVALPVYPDKDFEQKYLPEAKKFWDKVVLFEEPEKNYRDYRNIDSMEWENLAIEYRAIYQSLKDLEEKKEKIRKELIMLCGDQNSLGSGIKVLKKLSKGRVDYESIPELKEMDLNEYRKAATYSWTILLDQGKNAKDYND